eukprot:TRINITY_DN124371_c0_g1_i1.p1 TRINITY_DN124371_c0_g1~~TRINITY_DN124371_c0_g1_i1.p1  ORF type:complete len:425 (-),score=60.72 TRINITY_DN124371_c0_g1_i1:81-1322(-)
MPRRRSTNVKPQRSGRVVAGSSGDPIPKEPRTQGEPACGSSLDARMQAAAAAERSSPSRPAAEASVAAPGRLVGLDVICQELHGPRGETLLDPVHAELRFLARCFNYPSEGILNYLPPSRYPTLKALGALPAAYGRYEATSLQDDADCLGIDSVVPRSELLKAASSLLWSSVSLNSAETLLTVVLSGRDRLLYDELGSSTAVSRCLWLLDDVYAGYTKATLRCSAPLGMGHYVAWSERQRQLAELGEAKYQSEDTLVAEVKELLSKLAERLGESRSFGGDSSSGSERLSLLDARAYSHLAVLYSIPRECCLCLHTTLANWPGLRMYCARIEQRLAVWPSKRAFLAASVADQRAVADREVQHRLAAEAARLQHRLDYTDPSPLVYAGAALAVAVMSAWLLSSKAPQFRLGSSLA